MITGDEHFTFSDELGKLMVPSSFYREDNNYTPDDSASVLQSVELLKKDGGCSGVEHFARF